MVAEAVPVHVSPLPLHDIRQALGAEPQHYVPLVRRRHLHLEPLQASVSGRLNNLPHHSQTQSATSLDVHGTSHKPIITYAAIECARHGQDSSKLGTSRPKQPRMLPAIKRVRYIGWCLLGGFQKARGRAHLERTRDVGSGRDIGHDEQLLGHGPVVLANVALRSLGYNVHRIPERVAHHVYHRHLCPARPKSRVRIIKHIVCAVVPLPPWRLDERLHL